MIRRVLAVTYLVAFALLFIPRVLFAQDAPPDMTQVAVDSINALVAPTTLAVLWVLKAAWSKIPASLVLFAAPVVGLLVNYGIAWVTNNPPASPIVAALLGAVSTYAREFLSTLQTKGLNGPVTPTPLNF